MENIDDIFNPLITEEARETKRFIQKNWINFDVILEVPLRELFPKPDGIGLKSIWEHGSADVVIYHKQSGNIVAIFEPGGCHHFTDPLQIKRDKRKWKLCQINGVRCFRYANNLLKDLSNRKKRRMFGKFLFGSN